MTNKIKLFTDSAADVPLNYREKYQIDVVPLSIIFGETEFIDQVTLSIAEFWDRLINSDELPSTNQVNPHQFAEAFKPYLDDGYTILYVGLSAALSGTFQSANIAKQMLETENIYIFDSKSASLGETLLLITAGEMIEKGHNIEEIMVALEEQRSTSFGNITVDSLDHLVRGGRLSKAQAVVGGMLNIKPLIIVNPDGTIGAGEKIRSTKKALQTIVAKAKNTAVDFSKRRVGVLYTHGTDPKEFVQLVKTELQPLEILETLIGPVAGTHVGPSGIALFF